MATYVCCSALAKKLAEEEKKNVEEYAIAQSNLIFAQSEEELNFYLKDFNKELKASYSRKNKSFDKRFDILYLNGIQQTKSQILNTSEIPFLPIH